MIQNLVQTLKFISDYLIITGVSIFGIFILFSIVFNDFSGKVKSRFSTGFILILVSNVLLFLMFSLLFTGVAKIQTGDFEILAFISLIVFTVIFNLNLLLKMKTLLPKAKKGGNLYELSKEDIKENSSRVINLFFISTIILAPMYIFGNGSINGLLVVLFTSVLICAFTSIFLFIKILRFSEKLFN